MQESVTYQSIKAEGSQEAFRLVAVNLLREGMTIEAIARVTGLSVEQVQRLQAEASN